MELLANPRREAIEEELGREHKQLGRRCRWCDGQLDYKDCQEFRSSFRRDE